VASHTNTRLTPPTRQVWREGQGRGGGRAERLQVRWIGVQLSDAAHDPALRTNAGPFLVVSQDAPVKNNCLEPPLSEPQPHTYEHTQTHDLPTPPATRAAPRPPSKRLKELLEHATQFPEEYSRVASVQKKARADTRGDRLAADGEGGCSRPPAADGGAVGSGAQRLGIVEPCAIGAACRSHTAGGRGQGHHGAERRVGARPRWVWAAKGEGRGRAYG
jgi:hypothetical protein